MYPPSKNSREIRVKCVAEEIAMTRSLTDRTGRIYAEGKMAGVPL
jgi:hypothetical protein